MAVKINSSVLISLVFLSVTLIWIGSGFFKDEKSLDTPEASEAHKSDADGSVKSVRVMRSSADNYVSDIVVNGRTKSSRTVEIKAEIDGKIIEVNAERGVRVKKDQIIARIEVNARKANMLKARELVKQREIEYKASKNLTNKGFNSKIRLATSKADLEAAKADLKAAEIEFNHTVIKAPFEGVLEERTIELGTYLKSDTAVGKIVDLDPMDVIGFVSERHVSEISVGKDAYAILPDGREVQGTISYIAATADDATRTFQVEIELPNADHSIVEGLTAKLRLPGKTQQAHKISPAYLSLDDAGIIGVKTVNDAGKVGFHRVNVLSDTASNMWVDGLPEQINLITVGQNFVSVGQSVEVVFNDEGEKTEQNLEKNSALEELPLPMLDANTDVEQLEVSEPQDILDEVGSSENDH